MIVFHHSYFVLQGSYQLRTPDQIGIDFPDPYSYGTGTWDWGLGLKVTILSKIIFTFSNCGCAVRKKLVYVQHPSFPHHIQSPQS